MFTRILRITLVAAAVLAATSSTALAQTCVTIDEPRDMLSRDERTAAVLLVRKQFDLAGQASADRACETSYVLSHIRLGTTIVVTLSGPLGTREGTALGLDDLPAVYSQMVRSLTTGEPMGSLAVLDRTNVSAVQDQAARRIQSDGSWYARLGYGSLFGRSREGGPQFGFGYRAAFDRFGIDFSFLNFQQPEGGSYSGSGTSALSLISMEGLYFTSPKANSTAYFGGGLSYGRIETDTAPSFDSLTSGRGSGLQAELTAGYEMARVTSVRIFAQLDVTLPLYDVEFDTVTYSPTPPNSIFVPPTITTERFYMPTVAVSIGFGWQPRRR